MGADGIPDLLLAAFPVEARACLFLYVLNAWRSRERKVPEGTGNFWRVLWGHPGEISEGRWGPDQPEVRPPTPIEMRAGSEMN